MNSGVSNKFNEAVSLHGAARTKFNGYNVGIIEGGKFPAVEAPLYVYALRHTTEDHSIPATIEKVVAVDKWGYLISEEDLFGEGEKFNVDESGTPYLNLSVRTGQLFSHAVEVSRRLNKLSEARKNEK